MPRASGVALGRIIVQRCVFSGNGPSVMVFGSAGAGVCASRVGLFLWRMGSFKAKPWPEPTPHCRRLKYPRSRRLADAAVPAMMQMPAQAGTRSRENGSCQ